MPGWITLARFKHIVSKSWTHAREDFVNKDWSQTSISRDSVWSWDDVRGYWGSPEVCQRSFSPSKQISASAAIVMGWCVSACSTRTFGCVSLLDSPEWDVRWVVFSIRLVGYQTFKALWSLLWDLVCWNWGKRTNMGEFHPFPMSNVF